MPFPLLAPPHRSTSTLPSMLIPSKYLIFPYPRSQRPLPLHAWPCRLRPRHTRPRRLHLCHMRPYCLRSHHARPRCLDLCHAWPRFSGHLQPASSISPVSISGVCDPVHRSPPTHHPLPRPAPMMCRQCTIWSPSIVTPATSSRWSHTDQLVFAG